MSVRSYRLCQRLLCAATASVLSYGINTTCARIWAAKLADDYALPQIDQALIFARGNSEYWLRRAQLLDQAGLAGNAELRRAAELNPWDASVWIRLGIDAEARGDLGSAEDHLLCAARVNRLYQPRWTLANFYFRRGARAEFWNWTRQALELAPRDGTPLFQLCWVMSQDPEEILDKAIPPNPKVVESYASFLLAANRLDAAAQLFAGSARQAQVPLLLSACDRFIDAAMIDAAVTTWNAAISGDPLDPKRGASLTNGAFAVPTTGRGFTWRFQQTPGVSATIGSGVAAVFFDGREPEHCEPVAQLIPVVPGRKYQLQFEYKTSGIPPQSGLKWQSAAVGPVGTLGSSASLSSDDWKHEVVEFQAPPGVRLVRLSLTYSRASGAVRIEGSALTRAMRLL